MGILDEAIREHLELKRQHGAEETELKGLEDEAFGQAERPDAAGPSAVAEAETQIISPGSSVTAPAGEGDQLDKVFEGTRQAEADDAEANAEAETRIVPPDSPDATFAEHPVPEPPAPETEAKADPELTDAATVESPEAKPAEPEPAAEAPAPEEGDAGDMLEAERHHLASHPTEHYDVDAAIAEEDEIDILSEGSLSDELDRALDSGEVAATGGETVEYDVGAEEDSAEHDLDEPESGEIDSATDDADSTEHEADEDDSAELLYEDAATESQPAGDEDSGDFFDQEDPLEATPDFLEETPEHDRLWFEQKEPKDFDFGD
jgi:hypothetical protein